ncbi:hypothetical protein PtB15_17B317 [Puccinia triticina]|nr:hypothetical protein PtB15_17B317 [Puccinia triticina]
MAKKLPLPHFLNLPLPTIPCESSSSKSTNSSSSTDTNGSSTSTQPLVFKLNLSPEQYEELLNLDAEVEEGEEGGLRVEFDPSGKAALHLNSERILQLNPPRSGPSRTNRPEEIYRHTPTSPAPSTRSSLSGLFRIPPSSTVYDLQRSQPSSDLPIGTSTQTRAVEPPKPSSKPTHPTPSINTPQPPRPARLATESSRSEKERLAGQRLKEKRQEDDRKKKEKQIAILPDAPATTPAARRPRPTKVKAATKQTSFVAGTQSPSTTPLNGTLSSSRSKPLPSAPVPQPPPPRRALPGSQSGKQIAHGLNQHLANSSAALSKPPPPQPQSEALPPAQPLPAPAPPPVTFKPSSSNKRGKTAPLNAPPSEPPSATKLSPSTEKSEADHRQLDTPSQPLKPPSPPVATLKPKDSTQASKSSPRLNAVLDEAKTHSLPEAPGLSSERTASSTSAQKRNLKKQAPSIASRTSGNAQVERAPSPSAASDAPSSSSKRPQADTLLDNPTPLASRPKKTQRRDGNERRPADDSPAPPTKSTRPRSNSGATRPEDQPRKSGITMKKVPAPATVERNTSHAEAGGTPPITKKRALEAEAVPPSNALNKRVRQEEGGGSLSASGLPTIRKVVRPPPAAPVEPEPRQNGQAKRVKKKKKLSRRVDYTSSEVEEGEEPGEIVNVSSKHRATGSGSASNSAQAVSEAEAGKAVVPPGPTREDGGGRAETKGPSTSPPQATKLDGKARASERSGEAGAGATTTRTGEERVGAAARPGGASSPSYKLLRLQFHKLLRHYEFVCARIEEYKSDDSAISNLQEVEELVFEVHGLELELDRLRQRLTRNYL